MSDLHEPSSSRPRKEDPETLVLRGTTRPAVRFRRGLIAGITGAVAVALVTLSWLALEPPNFRKAAASIDSGEDQPKATPDALANVPRNYGDVPKLGPPLPGDLGRPILEQQRSEAQPISAPPDITEPSNRQSAVELGRERAAGERQAARTAGLMVQLGSGEAAPSGNSPVEVADAASPPAAIEPAAAPVPAGQQHKIDFVAGEGGMDSPHQLMAAASPWMLSAGTIIPASLITGLNSDLPGMVLAQVTENVRDSATGRVILVPQGARLIGKYDSVVAFGQRRALLIWTRIVFPDGSSVELDDMPATDAWGYSGVTDGVDSHTWQLLKGIGMSTLLGVGTELSFGGSGSGLVRALRESAQENAPHAGDQITSRNLDIQPTITVRPGWPVRALVNKDIGLQPWRG
ncbi:MAG TPA: TrbI/VirB10 family protein [Sphingomicrobium sp.]|nr:TrbI/VirB10 family protein [Sphingomicrobium sp.]